ncbi:MAG: endonuclease MutS2, partial [Chloroflexi bacterium]
MNVKHLSTLDFPKILDRLVGYASFSAGEELARALTPATSLPEIRWRMETTSEARTLLEIRPETTLGGAHDVRPVVEAARRGAVLTSHKLLDVRDTLVAGQNLRRHLTRLESQFPLLAEIAVRIERCPELVTEIDRCLDERGDVRDGASPELARIRREISVTHERLQSKLENIIHSPRNATFLQEPLITQREGRYVIP